MNKAVSPLSIPEEISSKQMAIVIPLHPAEKVVNRRARKKKVILNEGIVENNPAPVFTSPVFRPKKHDLL